MKSIMRFLRKEVMQIPLWAILVCCVYGPLITIVVFLSPSGKYSSSIDAYGVDSRERLYVGLHCHIEVYEDGVLVDSFSSKTSAGYAFRINEDDTILLSTGSDTYLLDLQGNELSHTAGGHTISDLKAENRKPLQRNGNTYRVLQFWWPRIVMNGETVVYRLPVWMECLRIAVSTTGLGFAATVIYLVFRKREKSAGGSAG